MVLVDTVDCRTFDADPRKGTLKKKNNNGVLSSTKSAEWNVEQKDFVGMATQLRSASASHRNLPHATSSYSSLSSTPILLDLGVFDERRLSLHVYSRGKQLVYVPVRTISCSMRNQSISVDVVHIIIVGRLDPVF